MRRWQLWASSVLLVVLAIAGYVFLSRHSWGSAPSTANAPQHTSAGGKQDAPGTGSAQPEKPTSKANEQLSEQEIQAILAPKGVKLPETKPPADLPLVDWGSRDYFPMIRKPRFLTAEQGDTVLAKDEPILGLVVGTDSRAYSTNQLNRHEMVLDEVGGVPVLVTY